MTTKKTRRGTEPTTVAPTTVGDTPPENVPVGKRGRPAALYPVHYNLMLRIGDRERFDDFAYRHRLKKGEAMSRLLDLADADEANQARSAGLPNIDRTDGSNR